MLKIVSAAVLAASIFAAPAMAATTKSVHGNPLSANARLMSPVIKAKPVVTKAHAVRHSHHHKMHRHFHRHR